MKFSASIQTSISTLFNRFIQYPATRYHHTTAAIWLLILYLVGIFAWGYFFSWGKVNLEFHDWSAITAPRLQFLKDAATHLELPLHISETRTLNNVTNRYLSVPDAFISFQAIFLRWMDVGEFVFFDTLLLYTLGFWGLLLIRTRFRLSSAAFSILFLLFNFNGHILAHLSVGHATWSGYFLFPFFAILIINLFDGRQGWSWVAKMAILMASIFLQGSFHQYVWLLLFLLLTAVGLPKYFKTCLLGAFSAVMISLFRILPPAMVVNSFDREFISGYPTVESLWNGLVSVALPGDITTNLDMTKPIGFWELTLFIGLAGALFLIGFGLYQWLRTGNSQIERRLIIPLLAMTVLAMGNVYQLISLLPVPLFNGERVSARMISVVFVFLTVIAVAEFQRWVEAVPRKAWFSGAAALGIVLIAQDLWKNLALWQVNHAFTLFPERTFTPALYFVNNNYGDRGYLLILALGAAVSSATLLALGCLALRESRQKRKAEANAV